MTDLLERLTAANPAREGERPPIGDVWRKAAAPEPARPPRVRGAGRGMFAVGVVTVPVIVVAALALTMLGGRPHPSAPATRPAAGEGQSTLDPAAQRAAATQLAGHVGTVIALDPRTGAIRALVTSGRAAGPQAAIRSAAFASAPGATFDIVTAAAALDSGRYSPQTQVAAPAVLRVSGVTVRNDSGVGYGRVSLTDGLDYSANTVFARVGSTLGRRTMSGYMRRFGFYTSVHIGGSRDRIAPSGVVLGGRLVPVTDPQVRLGPLAVGRGLLTATPLQMAMVASAVADDGMLMAPHLDFGRASPPRRVIAPASALALRGMLRTVVTRGSGTPADLPGLGVAGQTGTVAYSTRGTGPADVWFVGLAPVDHPTVAIAVLLHEPRGGFGGTAAGPIAARVIRALRGR